MTDEVTAGIAARRSRLIVDRVRKRFDDRVGEEPLAHLPELTLDLLARLATIRKRDAKQLAGAHIFHPFKPKRTQRMLNGLPLRVENGRLQLDDDGGFHGGMIRGCVNQNLLPTVIARTSGGPKWIAYTFSFLSSVRSCSSARSSSSSGRVSMQRTARRHFRRRCRR